MYRNHPSRGITPAVSDAGTIRPPLFQHTGVFTVGVTPWGAEPGRYLVTGADGLYRWQDVTGVAARVADLPVSLLKREIGAPASTDTHRNGRQRFANHRWGEACIGSSITRCTSSAQEADGEKVSHARDRRRSSTNEWYVEYTFLN